QRSDRNQIRFRIGGEERRVNSLNRFPAFLILFAWCAYLGWKVYDFNTSPEGEVEQHRAKVVEAKKTIQGLREKIKEGEAFMKTLEAKKEELRAQSKKLAEYQGALSEQADSANLVKLLLTEAKKLEIRVDKIEPGKKNQQPYYLEQQYDLDIRGSFQQFLLFMLRISKMQRILRIENYKFRLSPSMMSPRSVTLSGSLAVSSYQYTMSQEDSIGREVGGSTPPVQPGSQGGGGRK
ncbi:MAG: hypothetical protein EBX52_14050, partial [Proteobacteria bacterium]|nr:hypothetical protein [Pseudomonadota bacterium]